MSETATYHPAKRSVINLLVCASCDHPLCTEEDVLAEKLDMPATAGFAYEFDDVFEDMAVAPWCYRVNVDSDIVIDIRRGRERARDGRVVEESDDEDEEGGQESSRRPSDIVAALTRALAPVADQDTISLMREGIAYQNGTGEILTTMVPSSSSSSPSRANRGSHLGDIEEETDNTGDNPEPRPDRSDDGDHPALSPESPTSRQIRSMLVPDVVSRTSKTNTDLIRVGLTVGPASVTTKRLRRPHNDIIPNTCNNNGGGGGGGLDGQCASALDHWFGGKYQASKVVYCASCSASLGWGFDASVVEENESKSRSNENDIITASSVANDRASAASVVPAAVRANPFGPRAPSIFGTRCAQQIVATPTPTACTAEEETEKEKEKKKQPFICFVLKNVKHRVWAVRDVARQCLVSAAVARRQALDLLQNASLTSIAQISTVPRRQVHVGAAISPSEEEAEEEGVQREEREESAAVAEAATEVAEVIAAAAREAARRAEIQAILDEDTISRRRLEALMNARINEAVEERTRHLKLQADLVVTLLEKHKEQTTVLSQLLKGQKEKLRTQEDKISTYDQIFMAHRRQLETQTKHITFQDDLMRTLKIQAECQQRQIDSQQTILREQNGTIHKQNHHVREMQGYLRSLVESQVRMKQYLEAISERDIQTPETSSSALAPATAASFSSSSASASPSSAIATNNETEGEQRQEEVSLSLGEGFLFNHNQKTSEETTSPSHPYSGLTHHVHVQGPLAAAAATPPLPPAIIGRKTGGRVIASSVAREMLADLAVHEAEFGINYSALDGTSIAGQALLGTTEKGEEEEEGNNAVNDDEGHE